MILLLIIFFFKDHDGSYKGGSSHSVTPGYSYSKPKQIHTDDQFYNVQQETHQKTLQVKIVIEIVVFIC